MIAAASLTGVQTVVMWVIAVLVLLGAGAALRTGRRRSRTSRWGSWGRRQSRGHGRTGKRGPESRPHRAPLGQQALRNLSGRLDGALERSRSGRDQERQARKKLP